MQDLGPDMEDLLRKASENYPLKQADDRWDEIASKLSADPTHKSAVPRKTAGDKKYFAVFILLTLFLFSVLFISKQMVPVKLTQKEIAAEETKSQDVNKESRKQRAVDANARVIKDDKASKDNDRDYLDAIKRSQKKQAIRSRSTNVDVNSLKISSKQGSISEESDELVNEEFPTGNSDVPGSIFLLPYRDTVAAVVKINPLDSINTFPFITPDPKEQKTNSSWRRKRLYYGLIMGPGFNSIKKQGVNKAGLNIGILAGYQFTSALSLETGLLLSQKFYSTSGDHFSMKVIGPAMPSGMHVMEIDGNTRVIEIPLHLRYTMFQNTKRSFFSLAGISSYIVDNEYNQYHTSMNGTEKMMYVTYKNNSGYFASSINLGIGYEQSLGKKRTIRFQPYVQLPLQGIGVGDLHVVSTGFYIGITRTAR